MNLLPPRADLVLNPLAVVLTTQVVERCSRLAAANPAEYEPSIASSLNNLKRVASDGSVLQAITFSGRSRSAPPG